jgi:hypothetical protein
MKATFLGLGLLMLAVALTLTGCPPKTTEAPHGHGSGTPHDGDLFAPEGDDHPLHAELVMSDKDSKGTIYLYDADVKKPSRQDKDPQGKSSRFVTEDDLPRDLDLEKVEIKLDYEGKPWTLVLDD